MVENGVNVTFDKSEELLASIKDLSKNQVLVGIPASSPSRAGESINNASLGYIHEFGSPAQNIPARPFLIPTINRLRDKAVAMLKQAAEYQFDHKQGEAKNVLNALGLMASQAVKNNIVAGGDPKFTPLAPATIARRTGPMRMHGLEPDLSSVKPLIDTGQMLNSITYVIRKKP
jgi:phage gpG-like protein